MKKYDFIVIGGGAGGLVAAAGAAQFGAKVALIERNRLGGDCLWTGCIPTKTLTNEAKKVYDAFEATKIGLQVSGKPDFNLIKERIQQSVFAVGAHDDPQRFLNMGIDLYEGQGSFAGPHEIELSKGQQIYGKRIVIATGSRPFIPNIKGLANTPFLTNEAILQMNDIPRHLLVIGSGPTGIEIGQSFARLGSEVTIIEKNKTILAKEDDEIVAHLLRALKQEGISFICEAAILEVFSLGMQKHVRIQKNDGEQELIFDAIFVATGREPNVMSLSLDQAGIKERDGFIAVNERLQTTIPHIYAVGDVNGKFLFSHAAGAQGKIAVANAVFGLKQKLEAANMPWVIFTDPEIFHLGWTEREARERVSKIKVHRLELDQVDRCQANHEANGLIKIITDQKGYILGAHAVGRGAGEFMQEIVTAKKWRHQLGKLSQVIHPYPTGVTGVQQVADFYWREKLNGNLAKWLKAYVQWFR